MSEGPEALSSAELLGILFGTGSKENTAVELAGLGLYSVTIDDGRDLLTWDDRVCALWGLPPGSEITYDMWRDAIHADDRERVQTAVANAYDPSGTGIYDAEYRVIGADGVERWVATRAQARFEQGKAVSLLGVVRDITGRKMIEHGLELSAAVVAIAKVERVHTPPLSSAHFRIRHFPLEATRS